MRTVGPSEAELNAVSHSGNWLMQIESPDGSEVYRFTNATRDLTWDGHTWQQLPIYPGEIVSDQHGQSAVEVLVEDVDRAMVAIVLASDMVDWYAYLWDAWLDDSFAVTSTTLEMEGMVDQCDYDPTTETNMVSMNLVGSHIEQQMMPGEKFTRTCRYRRFKGERCGYTGAALTCNRTFARCSELNNRQRFGGFRFLPEPGKTITIGGKQTRLRNRREAISNTTNVTWGEW